MPDLVATVRFIDELSAAIGELPANLLVCAVTVALALLLAHKANKSITRRLTGSEVGELSLIVNIVRVVIAVVALFFLGENVFHIEMGGAAQALGVTTLVVSLGLQDLIKSIVAGVLVVVGDIVSKGDQVIMGDHRGEVMDINWHQITIRDRDGVPHIIPNSELMSDTFMRVTGKMACRHIFECDIAPGCDLDVVKDDMETRAGMALARGGWAAEGYAPQILFLGSTAFGTTASVRIFISDIEYATRAMDAVMRSFSERGYLADCTHEVDPRWKGARTQQMGSTTTPTEGFGS